MSCVHGIFFIIQVILKRHNPMGSEILFLPSRAINHVSSVSFWHRLLAVSSVLVVGLLCPNGF